jgi:hypothetical protein
MLGLAKANIQQDLKDDQSLCGGYASTKRVKVD